MKNTMRHRGRGRGVVMIITLLAVILLAAMVMFTINVGVQTNRRVVTQHAADVAATSGGGWVARNFNAVAMNNVAMSRQIALVNILDALPMATQFTREDQEAALKIAESTVSKGIPQGPWVVSALQEMSGQLQREVVILKQMEQFFAQHEVMELTFYQGPAGRGKLWLSMEAMDDLNQVMMQTVGALGQVNAVRGAESNMQHDDVSSAAMMVPAVPDIPWRRGYFDQFERPVKRGLLPEETDDQEFNRGPYDAVFGWRNLHGGGATGYWVDDGNPKPLGGKGKVPIGSGAGAGYPNNGHFVKTGEEPPDSYSTYGPYAWLMGKVGWWGWERLPHSRFRWWEDRIANIKLGYLWPGTEIKNIVDPQWVTDFNEAVAIAEQSDPPGTDPKIHETAFLVVEIKSRFPRDNPGFMSPGSWAYILHDDQHEHKGRVVRLGGWVDPRKWGVPKIADYVWRDEWSYQIYADPDIGLAPQYTTQVDPITGETTEVPIPQDAYRVDDFTFAGINVGDEVPIRNPHNFSNRDDLPSPMDLDHSKVGHDEGSRRQFLTYLSVARFGDRADMWPSKFEGKKPYPNHVAIAQVEVFNNHSWDLWTQMWHSQLQPVEGLTQWVDQMQDTADDLELLPNQEVSQQEYADIQEYLTSLETLGPVMLRH